MQFFKGLQRYGMVLAFGFGDGSLGGGAPQLLLFCIVDLNPIPIGVFEVDLFNAVHAVGDGAGGSAPVFKGDIVLLEYGYELVHRRYAEAEVGVFIVGSGGLCAGNNMEVALFTYTEPGMAAIVKRFGNGIEADDMLVKMGAGLEVGNVDGDVVEGSAGCSGGCYLVVGGRFFRRSHTACKNGNEEEEDNG